MTIQPYGDIQFQSENVFLGVYSEGGGLEKHQIVVGFGRKSEAVLHTLRMGKGQHPAPSASFSLEEEEPSKVTTAEKLAAFRQETDARIKAYMKSDFERAIFLEMCGELKVALDRR